MIITLDEALSTGRGIERSFNCPAMVSFSKLSWAIT